MPIEFSLVAFAERTGQAFRVWREGVDPVELKLVKVDDLRRKDQNLPPGVRQDPFQLLFAGPAEPLLPQGTYSFAGENENTDQQEVQLFMAPIGPGEGGMLYNVVIN